MFGCRANALHCHGAVMQIHGLHLGFNGHCMFSFRPLSIYFFSSLYLCNAAVCGICTCSWGAKCRIVLFFPLFPFYDSLSFFSCPFLKKLCKRILALSVLIFFAFFCDHLDAFWCVGSRFWFVYALVFTFFYLYLLRLFFERPHSACWAEGAAWFSYVNIVVLFKLFIPFLTHFEIFCPVFVIRSTPLFFTSPWSAHFRWSSQNEQAFLNMECLSKLSARMDAIAHVCIRYFCAALLFVCLFICFPYHRGW